MALVAAVTAVTAVVFGGSALGRGRLMAGVIGRDIVTLMARVTLMAAVMLTVTDGLRQGGPCDQGEAERQAKRHAECQVGPHTDAPSSGRTLTTLNMPACMCISMWQWKAQSPGASAVRSKAIRAPGATLTVCLCG